MNLEKLLIENKAKFQQAIFTEDELAYLHNLGLKKLHANQINEAIKLLAFIVINAPVNWSYIKSLAGAFQANHQFTEAIANYKLAYFLQPELNHDCNFYIGVCLFELKNYWEAREKFNTFITATSQSTELIERAKVYLMKINRAIEE